MDHVQTKLTRRILLNTSSFIILFFKKSLDFNLIIKPIKILKKDTVVALDALAKFSSAYYSTFLNIKVAYKFNALTNTLFVNEKNRLLIQRMKLDGFKEDEPNRIGFDLQGYGTALVQLILKFSLIEQSQLRARNNFEFSIFQISSNDCKLVRLKLKAK